jgi:hypothetical protein
MAKKQITVKDNLAEQNKARKDLNLPLLQPKERKCLSCDAIFISATYRRCLKCRTEHPS